MGTWTFTELMVPMADPTVVGTIPMFRRFGEVHKDAVGTYSALSGGAPGIFGEGSGLTGEGSGLHTMDGLESWPSPNYQFQYGYGRSGFAHWRC